MVLVARWEAEDNTVTVRETLRSQCHSVYEGYRVLLFTHPGSGMPGIPAFSSGSGEVFASLAGSGSGAVSPMLPSPVARSRGCTTVPYSTRLALSYAHFLATPAD